MDVMKDHNMKEIAWQYAYAENYAMEYCADNNVTQRFVVATRIYVSALRTQVERLESALEKAQGPYKGDVILVTPEIVAYFRKRDNAEGWIEQWTESRIATLRDKHSSDPVWWVAVNDTYQSDIPHDLVKAARAAYIEYMTTP